MWSKDAVRRERSSSSVRPPPLKLEQFEHFSFEASASSPSPGPSPGPIVRNIRHAIEGQQRVHRSRSLFRRSQHQKAPKKISLVALPSLTITDCASPHDTPHESTAGSDSLKHPNSPPQPSGPVSGPASGSGPGSSLAVQKGSLLAPGHRRSSVSAVQQALALSPLHVSMIAAQTAEELETEYDHPSGLLRRRNTLLRLSSSGDRNRCARRVHIQYSSIYTRSRYSKLFCIVHDTHLLQMN